MNWFRTFSAAMAKGEAVSGLRGAMGVSGERALAHYRHQHEAKVREAIEESFPESKRHLGTAWDQLWQRFWESRPASPRSLDFFSEVFYAFVTGQQLPLSARELLRFEWVMERHPWHHERLELREFPELGEDTRLKLAPLDVHEFSVDVIAHYENTQPREVSRQRVVFWLKEPGLYYRELRDWEAELLAKLPHGLATALEGLTADEDEVQKFFQWLGSSGLVRG